MGFCTTNSRVPQDLTGKVYVTSFVNSFVIFENRRVIGIEEMWPVA